MEYVSIFRCKTKSVIWGFFTKQLADHMRKFEGTHTFPFTHPGVPGPLLESQDAKWAFKTLGRASLFDHWFRKKISKVQFFLRVSLSSWPFFSHPHYHPWGLWEMEAGHATPVREPGARREEGDLRGPSPRGEYTMNHRNSECLWHQSVNAQQSRSNQWPATDVYYSATLDTVRLIILWEHKNSCRKYKNLKHCPHVFYKNKMNNFLTLK